MNGAPSFKIGAAATIFLVMSSCELLGTVGAGREFAEPTLEALRAAPETVVVEGAPLVLRTFMWRDFAPITPPNGRPLIAIFRIVTADSTNVPDGLEAEKAWVIHQGEVWDAIFKDQKPPPGQRKPYQLYRLARDGPKIGPKVFVDAVVRLVDAQGRSHLLKAEQQYIRRTD